MYHYFRSWTLMLLLFLILSGSVFSHECTSKKAQVQAVPQNYSEAKFASHIPAQPMDNSHSMDDWMSIRVFADTSMLMTDVEACDRVGKYVRVGLPQRDSIPVCSSIIIDDCWQRCEEKDVLTSTKARQITDIMVPVVNWLASVVKVKQVVGNILIPKEAVPSGCADNLALPHYYSTTGVRSSDLVLVVTGRPTSSNTVAWATECAADQSGRPVFGHINIGPGELDDFENQKQFIFKVLLHELTHVLGFNSDKFPYFKDSLGKPYPSVTAIQIVDGKKINKIVTPRVVAAARDHFGCNEIDGVPLEDGGDSTTSDSHWEKRIFRNEFMTGSSDHTAVISKITLALLEDSGWYKVDYDHAEDLEWGSGMGCSFVNGRCSQWEDRKGYFCTTPGAKSCTSDRSAMGYCNLIRHRYEVPKFGRHFPSDSYFGGSDELSDYCPYVAAYANGICSDSSNQPESPVFGENFGDNSKCFESSLVKDGFRPKAEVQPMCYDFRCTEQEEETRLDVLVDTIWYPCPFGGQLENVSGFTGNLQCPNASFCSVRRITTNQYQTLMDSHGSVVSPQVVVFLLFIILIL